MIGVMKMTDHTFAVGDHRIKMISRQHGGTEFYARTRVYGAVDALSPELGAEVDRWAQVPVTDELRRSDPDEAKRIMQGYNAAKRRALSDVRAKLDALLTSDELRGVLSEAPQVKGFSVRAGCACGCSPGFIMTSRLLVGVEPVDIWIGQR